MNIFKLIKNLFRKNKTIQLPESTQSKENNRQAFKESIIKCKKTSSPIETDISAYLDSYYSLLENYEYTKRLPNSYTALININSQYGYTSNKNLYDEQSLLQNINENNLYTIQTQSKDGKTSFYHIKSLGYELPNFDKMIRLYLNCKNDNIAELVDNILKHNDVPNLYLKFYSSDLAAIKPRSEKVVIYADESNYEQILNNLNSLYLNNPELFQGSEYTCPFLPKINDFISYARQPITDIYYDLCDHPHKIGQSANSYIAEALEESFISSVNEITCSCEPELYKYLNEFSGSSKNRLRYVSKIPYLKENYYNYLINSMTSKLQLLSGKNNIQLRDLQPIFPQSSQPEQAKNYNEKCI